MNIYVFNFEFLFVTAGVFFFVKFGFAHTTHFTLESFFQELGLEKGASQASVRAAFIKLAKAHHPDKTRGSDSKDGERFKRIRRAYEALMAEPAPEASRMHEQADRTEEAFSGLVCCTK